MTDIIAARDVGKRFVAAVTPLDGLVLLMIGQFRAATSKPHTARLRPFPALASGTCAPPITGNQ